MEKAIQSILPGGEDVEIIVVNDGSSDGTSEVAKKYEEKYPGIVKAVDKENGGHGDAVNTGLAHATGVYFKVVDSDDWVDEEALLKILSAVKGFVDADSKVDMLISNYVYEKVGMTHKKVIHYRNVLPQNQVFRWDDIGSFHLDQYILMHSVIYRTGLLRECGLKLPKHTFYVDNIFVFQPLPFVKKLYYLDAEFYHYFIGREDQSVNETIMIGRIDQQIRVNKIMIDFMAGRNIKDKRLRNYMMSYLDIITTISSVLLLRSGTDENFEKKQELWQYLKRADLRLYYKLRHSLLGRAMNLPGKGGRKVSVAAYQLTQKFFGFN